MIISWLTGGLGNQMFQYAAGLSLASLRRTVLKLDVSWFREYAEYEDHNRYALSCFNISEQFATREEIDRIKGVRLTRSERLSVGLARRLHFFQYVRKFEPAGNWHPARSFWFYPEFLDLFDSTYLEGMWQSEKFFRPVADVLRNHFSFRYPPTKDVEVTLRLIQDGPSVAVHFRRGDYLRNPKFASEMGALGFDYYYRALEVVRQREPKAKLFVFSDDIDAVEAEFRPSCPTHFVRSVGKWNDFDKVRLMSHCDHAIIANSTFSWWGAWLNPSAQKLVVAPDPWFAGDAQRGRDVVPESWTKVPRSA